MIRRFAACLVFLAASSCGDFPRDSESTLERVRAERVFRVGLVAPLDQAALDPKAKSFLQRVGQAAGARPVVETGDTEPLLNRLEEGELDIVIGRFEKASPWKTLVSFGPPLRIERQKKTEFHLTAAARNGENAWIGLLEAEARNAGAEEG
jgi:DNA-binding transcriptional LysR family regulator